MAILAIYDAHQRIAGSYLDQNVFRILCREWRYSRHIKTFVHLLPCYLQRACRPFMRCWLWPPHLLCLCTPPFAPKPAAHCHLTRQTELWFPCLRVYLLIYRCNRAAQTRFTAAVLHLLPCLLLRSAPIMQFHAVPAISLQLAWTFHQACMGLASRLHAPRIQFAWALHAACMSLACRQCRLHAVRIQLACSLHVPYMGLACR